MQTVLEARNIIKDFSGVRALNQVSFKLERNTVHALCGENGAGKSTLIKVLSGMHPVGSFSGSILMDGEEKRFASISDSIAQGIGVIHQELNLFRDLSVMENLFVGHELTTGRFAVDFNAMYLETQKWLRKLKMEDVNPMARLGDLGIGKQQLVEIARVLRLSSVKVLILDEPTAALTDAETAILLDILRDLRAEGISIIYISHKLKEVMQIADDITVLRDGASVGNGKRSELTETAIIRMMVGRDLKDMYPDRSYVPTDDIYAVKNFSVREAGTGKPIVKNVAFALRRGEILGFFGLLGSGRTELLSSAYGSRQLPWSGEVFLDGKPLSIKSPHDSILNGIVYCTEDRKTFGIIPTMSVRENTTISRIDLFGRSLQVSVNEEILYTNQQIKDFNIKTPRLETKISNLSGGNQQKVLLGRSMLGETRVLILDEPTRGIDVGAKQEIYSIINKLANQGLSIIIISSELPEVLGISDRVIAMHEGTIGGVFDNSRKDLSEETVMMAATGMN